MSANAEVEMSAGGVAGTGDPIAQLTPFAATLVAEQPFRGYELGECLSSSEVSAVFKTADKNMERTVALKALRPASDRAGAVEEFFSQAGSVARVRHPGVARGLDAGRGGGAFFMAHEFLRGESLEAKVRRRQTGRLTERESLALVRDLAEVLQGLFENGQSHGDVRPDRIVVTDGGKPRLLGIEFAWTLAWPDDRAAFMAKPDFLPPEKIAGDLTVDIRGDLYSLGCLWHWALLGEPVFRGATPETVLERHLRDKPTPPRETDPRLSAATSQLVLWLLEKDRDARPRTPREFLRKLSTHPLLEGEVAGAAADGKPAEAEPAE